MPLHAKGTVAAPTDKQSHLRLPRLDALRGVAVVWMTAFHFCFDLDQTGIWRNDFLGDARWTLQRTAIVTLFLLCLGIGQGLAMHSGRPARGFWWRWMQVALGAALVSVGSYLVFPSTFIYFGVLHAAAVFLLLLRCIGAVQPRSWTLFGGAVLALHFAAQWYVATAGAEATADTFGRWWAGQPLLTMLGWLGHRPLTEDYVPLVPWLAVVCFGVAVSGWLLQRKPMWLRGGLPRRTHWLAWLGRHSLPWYLLHQPVLLALLWAATGNSPGH